ncbi:hypothetical protein [Rhizobium rosettiformans]|uniref:hypothetical protein n=1 Tax=Rhizobium rosettiformans TaxID=1368430 RepID=UPI002859E1F1|nr:hypothetical protein [Rhizobium rosettiformans]MDR7029815.1 hypothetical protein [Rhizobium rosettiformans]MDR7063529.1 hypothetical protein [Rhizobium rosettiformans]
MSQVLQFRRRRDPVASPLRASVDGSVPDVILLSDKSCCIERKGNSKVLISKDKRTNRVAHKKRAKKGAESNPKKAVDQRMSRQDFLRHVEEASRPQLKALFLKSWHEHQTLRRRTSQKTSPYELHSDLWDFRGFLRAMGGPCPGPNFSVDRPNTLDFVYAPGNIRWADATTQARNRTTNVVIPWRGKERTLAEWAEVTGLKRSTLSSRFNRGTPIPALFKDAKKPFAPTLEELRDAVEAVPDAVGGLPHFAPPPLFGPDEWPVGLSAPKWSAGYRHYAATAKKLGVRAESRAYFAAWVLHSRIRHRNRNVITPKYFYLTARDNFTPEELAERDAVAGADRDVHDHFKEKAILITVLEVLRRELQQRVARMRHPQSLEEKDRWVWFELDRVRRLAKDRPCLSPQNAFRVFKN